MRGRIVKSIYDTLTSHGRKAQISELEKGGVKSVTVLGADQLAALIEKALERALEQRMLELAEPDKARLLESAQQEFQRLRAELAGLEGETERKRQELASVESRLVQLHGDFHAANVSLEAELAVAARVGAGPVVDAQKEYLVILEVIRQSGVPQVETAERVARAVAAHLERERARTAELAARDQRGRIEMLERRLSKLNDQLSRTEADLESALRNTDRDEGVSSIFRTVEGLRETARDFERKRVMLSDIFTKNLSLQKGPAASA